MSIMEKVRKVAQHIRGDGFWSTARWAFASLFYYPVRRWIDTRFDRKYGTDTAASIDPSRFDVDDELRRHAVEYSATPERIFVRLLRQQDIEYSTYTFVDLGCGKGRTLLLAALSFPFKRVIGVEFEPRIHGICAKNIDTFVRAAGLSRTPEAVCMSAGEYEFPAGNIQLYLFNPFDEHIMSQVAGNLRRSIESAPRFVRVVYFHPNWDAPLLRLPGIEVLRSERFRDRKSLHGVGRVTVYEIPGPAGR